MKAVIEGRRYDTETAEFVASWSYGGRGDFEYEREELYRTPKGSWFIAGSGGPKTKYSQQTGQNEWSGGERITPLSPDEARRWLERAEEWDAIEEYFFDDIEDA